MTHDEANRAYLETKARREALEGKEKRLLETIEQVEPERYEIRFSEVLTIARLYNNNAIDSSHDFFRYGFLKGQRAAKAQMKQEKSAQS